MASGAVAALFAALMWRPALGLLRRGRPRWLSIAVPILLALIIALSMRPLFDGSLAALAVSVWAACCAWLAVIDVAERHLPWRLTLTTTATLLALLGVQSALSGSATAWGRAVAAGIVVTAVLFALAWWSRGRLGLGDVALGMPIAVLLGWLGWGFVLYGVAMGFVIGAVVAVVALALGRGRRGEFPFGPCMIAGAILGGWLNAMAP